jgi:hypothetical protein
MKGMPIHTGTEFYEFGCPDPWFPFDSDEEQSNIARQAGRCSSVCIPHLRRELAGAKWACDYLMDAGPMYYCLQVAGPFSTPRPDVTLLHLLNRIRRVVPEDPAKGPANPAGNPVFGKFGGGLGGRQALILYPETYERALSMRDGMDDAYSSVEGYRGSVIRRGCANYLEPLFGPGNPVRREGRIIHPERINEVLAWLI